MEADPLEASAFLGNDGELAEDWMKHFSDEDEALRTNPTLANIGDIRSLARQVVSGESQIGKLTGNRAFAILPNEHSTPEEITEYHTKTGRPDTKEGYGFGEIELPAGQKKDEKLIAKISQALFDSGASKSAGEAVMKGYMEYLGDLAKEIDVDDKLANTKANQQLKDLWRNGYDEEMKHVNFAIQSLAAPIDKDFAATLITETPYDPLAAQLFAKIGKMISEDPGLKEKVGSTHLTPGDAMAKINEIMANPYYITDKPTDKPANKALHEQLVQEVHELFKVKTA